MSKKSKNIKVLFATSEIAPHVKTGGLGDVSAALPEALTGIGVDLRVLIPGYSELSRLKSRPLATLGDIPGFPSAKLLETKLANGVPAIIVDCPTLYRRAGGPYQDSSGVDWPDNAIRFGLLSKVAAILGNDRSPIPWRPKIVHCNDWQTGLAPAYLHFIPGHNAQSVMTIHNLAYQGVFPPETVLPLGIPQHSFSIFGVEYYGNLSFLKAGLFYANRINTVSPTYAKEIQSAPLGFGMQGLLASRGRYVSGILNGIDTRGWNPETDALIEQNYDAQRLELKAVNKKALQQELELAVDAHIPFCGIVSRFTYQKGLDLLLEIVSDLIELPTQLVLLGTGERVQQEAFSTLARTHPGKVAVVTQFSERLAHLIEAGADIFLMPSRYEPCGLNQMYSQRYGTLPVVHATGGLADSVVDCTPVTLENKTASGFSFHHYNPTDFLATVKRAILCYRDQKTWKALQQNSMTKDFSWTASANQYVKLYNSLIKR